MPEIDVVTVFHRPENKRLAEAMAGRLADTSGDLAYELIFVDNTVENRGFAKACNLGARKGSSPYIAFLNPDLKVHGPILAEGIAGLSEAVIAGEQFGKPAKEWQDVWGCEDWVCGAALFVRQDWFESVGGFSEEYVWAWEETDLVRRALAAGEGVRSIGLSCTHEQDEDDRTDRSYKQRHLAAGRKLFRRRWHGE